MISIIECRVPVLVDPKIVDSVDVRQGIRVGSFVVGEPRDCGNQNEDFITASRIFSRVRVLVPYTLSCIHVLGSNISREHITFAWVLYSVLITG